MPHILHVYMHQIILSLINYDRNYLYMLRVKFFNIKTIVCCYCMYLNGHQCFVPCICFVAFIINATFNAVASKYRASSLVKFPAVA